MLAALGATLAPFLGAIPGSMITRKNIGPWYEHIKKPSWRPPNWAFGPVWTCLVTRIFDGNKQQVIFLAVWWDGVCELFGAERWRQGPLPFSLLNPAGTQLGLDPNFFWLPQCQGWSSLGCPKSTSSQNNVKVAFYEICLLWIAVAATGVNFYSVNKVIGLQSVFLTNNFG